MVNKEQDLLFKYFSGNCEKEEIVLIEQWIDLSPENRETFRKVESIWFSVDKEGLSPNLDEAWQEINGKIFSSKEISLSPTRLRSYWISGIAASIAVLLSVWFAFNDGGDWEKFQNKGEYARLYNLPDGSSVWLEEGSKMAISFSDDERSVRLKGEAFFNISKDLNRPLVLQLQQSTVRVTGTSFNVITGSGRNDQVTMASGTVEFYDTNDDEKRVSLSEGDEGVLDLETKDLIKRPLRDPNLIARQTGILSFKRTPLREVVEELQDYYGIQITLENDDLGNCLITSKFSNQKAEEVLTIIERLLSAELQQTEEGYILKGEGC